MVFSEESFILASCCLSPITRNSVLQELRVKRLAGTLLLESVLWYWNENRVGELLYTLYYDYLTMFYVSKTAF